MKDQDNAYAERINGTIKNEYLQRWNIMDFKDLRRCLKKAVNHYNSKRIHNNLINDYSPLEFKEKLVNLSPQERPTEIIYAEGNYRSEEHTSELQSRPHLVCRLLLEKKK